MPSNIPLQPVTDTVRVDLLNIGDELLVGQTVNTNASWLGSRLTALGAQVQRVAVVGDEAAHIQEELARSLEAADVLILTGGLGPTHDDVTREVVAEHLGLELVFDEALWELILRRFERRGRTPAESNRRQAMVPRGFEVLDNERGTAPGLWYDSEGGQVLVILPGVPRELQVIMDEQVLPRLRQRHDLDVIEQRILRTAGIGESDLQELVGDLSRWVDGRRLRLAYQAGTGGVRLRLTATAATRAEALKRLDNAEAVLQERIGAHIYGRGDELLETVVGRLLREHGATLATAESCTGGLLASRITDVPGSSSYFLGGVAAYSNASKRALLSVDAAVLEEEGAVSQVVAQQLARGARKRFGADYGIGITGVAGPGGGTPGKPVGTVWIAIAGEEGDDVCHYRLTTERLYNKEMSCTLALDRLRRLLQRQDRN